MGGTPSEWARFRFITKLREHSAAFAECVDRIAESLRREVAGYGVDVAIDASDLSAYANGQRLLYNRGPEWQAYSDPTPPGATGAPRAPAGRRCSTPSQAALPVADRSRRKRTVAPQPAF